MVGNISRCILFTGFLDDHYPV